ncbi:MAG: ATPase, T2SS/T4P/T4SS family [Candidatus Omnitrophica bacterium]|nr:ATPase, T2SS/T4P/T4SS family [Candidatus Omnitrophota bacterium]MDD5237137.1 ATPase, T2SS/T4P/T4SS family [Candidatus Omnitrophota bacterium]
MLSQVEIIDLLLKHGLVTQAQVDKALEEAKVTGLTAERMLRDLGFISEEEIANIKAAALGVPFIDLTDYFIDEEIIKLIPESVAKKYKSVPLFKIGNNLTVAMVNPQDVHAIDKIRDVTKADAIEPVLATEKNIINIIDSYFGVTGTVEDILRHIEKEKASGETTIIKLVNVIIMQAMKDRASDIHIEPEEDKVRVRYRIDGVLREINSMPKTLQSAVISRIKVLSDMDIAESRKPQDGRIRVKMETKDLDIRVSSFPTNHGENIVMRLLDKSSVLLGLKDLGFGDNDLKEFEKLIHRPNGIILVTGPTGSGKTTTLYAALSTINSVERNIITLEDPVEYELPMIRQTPVNPKAGITFATGLRSILRQDPDVIMVGEIRDRETADIAIQAALTGHLVLSTLHTNDAPSALTRLIDMGIEPFLISSSVIGILAQRLVRTICDKCKERFIPPPEVVKELGVEGKYEFYKGKGCDKCRMTGLVGRIGIYELLPIHEEIRNMVDLKKSADEIKRKAIEMGAMKTLRDDGIEKAKKGITTLEEVVRVTTKIE